MNPVSETKGFVEVLFKTLTTKSYVKTVGSEVKQLDQVKVTQHSSSACVPVQPAAKQPEPDKKKEEIKVICYMVCFFTEFEIAAFW